MRYERSVELPASAEAAWRMLAAVRDWPSWTPTVEAVETDADPLQVGAVAVVKQPGRAAVRYRVDLLEPGRRFRWGNSRFGVDQSADHVVEPTGDTCTATLTFSMTGPVGALLGALGAGKIRRYVDTEARSLRSALERAGG